MSLKERIVIGVLWVFAGIVFAMLYGPAILVAVFSFFDHHGSLIDPSTFSLKHYKGLLSDDAILSALSNTVEVAVVSVLIAMVFAVGLAYYMRLDKRKGRSYVEFVIFLPFVLPAIITGISLLTVFQELGIDRSLFTVAVGHIVIVVGIIYRMVMVRLEALENSQIDASADLGATHFQTFRLVVAPQLVSAMVTGALLAFTISFDETLVTFFMIGDEPTLPLRLWAMMRVGFSPEINALVTVVLVGTMLLAASGALLMRRSIASKSAA